METDYIEDAVTHVKTMSNSMHDLARELAKKAENGHELLVLTTMMDKEFVACLSKLATINYFWTKPSPEIEESTFKQLLHLRDQVEDRHIKSVDRLMPAPVKVSPNLIKISSMFNSKRSMPDNPGRKSIERETITSTRRPPTTSTTPGSWFGNIFTTPKSTTTTAATTTTTTTTTTTMSTTTTLRSTTTTTQATSSSRMSVSDLLSSPDVPPFMKAPMTPMSWSEFSGVTESMNDSIPERSQNLVWESINGNNKVTSSDPSHHSLNRQPRQFITSLLVSLAASVGVGSVFGSIENSQIDHIRQSLDSVTEKEKLLVHQLSLNSKYIQINRDLGKNLAKLASKLKMYTELNHFKLEGAVLYMLIHSELTQVHREMDRMIAIISSAHQNRFHPEIFTPDGAEQIFSDVKGLASKNGLVPVIQTARQLSQMETHFYIDPTSKGGAHLILEVPLASENSLFALHRYDSLPISLGPFVHAKIEARNPILAIGGLEPSGHPRYVELSSSDLGLCRKLGKVYVCPHLRVVKKPNQESCLYALFINDPSAARKACRLSLKPQQSPQVVPVSTDSFLHYSPEPSSYFLRCTNGSVHHGYHLSNITKISLPHGCIAETSDFVLLRANDLFKTELPKTYKFSYTPLTFLSNTTTIKGLNDAAKFLQNLPNSPPLDEEAIKMINDLDKSVLNQPWPLWLSVILAVVATLVTTGFITYLCVRARQRQTQARLDRDPIFRLKNLFENEERMERLETLLK